MKGRQVKKRVGVGFVFVGGRCCFLLLALMLGGFWAWVNLGLVEVRWQQVFAMRYMEYYYPLDRIGLTLDSQPL